MMYSVVMMLAMTQAQSTPQEVFPHRPHLLSHIRSGCAGSHALAVVQATRTHVREVAGAAWSHRPHLFGHLKTGCSGGSLTSKTVTTTKTSIYQKMPAGPGPSTAIPPPVAGPLLDLRLRLSLHTTLNKMEASGQFAGNKRSLIRLAIHDGETLDKLTVKIQSTMMKSLGFGASELHKIGDGVILKFLWEHREDIIRFIQEFVKLFSYWSPMPSESRWYHACEYTHYLAA